MKAWSSQDLAAWLAMGRRARGALLTSVYAFRMVFLTFFGGSKTPVSHKPGPRMLAPLIILAVLSIIGGFVELPETLGNLPLFSDFLQTVFSEKTVEHGVGEGMLQIIASIVSLAGIFIAYLFFVRASSSTLIGSPV